MGFLKIVGDLLAGKTISTSSSTSSSTSTSVHSGDGPAADLPSPVRGQSSSTRTESRTTDGVSQQRRVSFTRYVIDPADAARWADRLTPIAPPPTLPTPPAGWWEVDTTARFFDVAPIAQGDGFVALAPDDAAVYVYSEH